MLPFLDSEVFHVIPTSVQVFEMVKLLTFKIVVSPVSIVNEKLLAKVLLVEVSLQPTPQRTFPSAMKAKLANSGVPLTFVVLV